MPIQFRRGTDAQRTAVTPAAGEPIWVTDTTKLYVGDGTTAGGIEIAGGGGGGGAPTNLSYLVLTASTSLSAERVLTISTGLASTDAGAGGALTIAIGTHAASFIGSGTVALARGGLGADISATGPGFLRQTSAGAAVSVAAIAATDLPTHNHVASNITSGTLAVSVGGLAADLSTTGGTAQILKQTAVGSAISVGTIAATEVGTSGTPSTSTFLRGDMTWGTPAGGGGGSGTKTYAAFTPLDNVPQTSAFATLDTRTSGVPVLDFDSTSLEAATFTGLLPEAAVTTNGLKVRLAWTADTVTNTDAVVWGIQFQRIDTTTDLDTDAFSNTFTATAAASGTAGVPVITELTITGTALLDSVVAGDFYRIRISRDGTHTSDALTADACLVACEIRDAT
jgi:hypothetical protein